jgi:hypothetical protein
MDEDEETNWFKKFGSSEWWFGENSMFSEALQTASRSGFEFGDIRFNPQANVGISNDKLVNYALIGGLMILLFRK